MQLGAHLASRPMVDHDVQQVSAGGVVVRHQADRDEVCLILRDRHGPRAWNLPKGHVERGEEVTAAALREVREETGLTGRILAPLTPISYRFSLKGDPTTYAKTVHFFLMRFADGDLSDHDAEVLEARWMSLDEALAQLEHENERDVVREARRMIKATSDT